MDNLWLFYGENTYFLNQELKRWKESFIEKHGDINIETLNGETCAVKDIIFACDAVPFLGEKRLVIVKNFISSQKSEETDRKKEDQKALIAYLKQVPSTCVLVFFEQSVDKRRALFKKIKEAGTIKEFENLKGTSLSQWILEEVNKRGGKIEFTNAQFLAEMTGRDVWQLNQEINKLLAYKEDKQISREDIEKTVSANFNVSIFAFVDAVGQRNAKKALDLFHGLLDRGESLQMIFYMIVRQFRLLLQVRYLLDKKFDYRTITSKLKLIPFQTPILCKQALNFSSEELKEIYRILFEIDIDIKTGKIPATQDNQKIFILVLERMIVKRGFLGGVTSVV